MKKQPIVYGQDIITVAKIVKTDAQATTTDFGDYENMTIVPVVAGSNIDDDIRAIMSEEEIAQLENDSIKDSEKFARVGAKVEPKLASNHAANFAARIREFRESLGKKEFDSCYAIIAASSSMTKRDDGEFINLRPTLIKRIKRSEIKEHIERFSKSGKLWNGVFKPKDSAVSKSSETTSNTYANAWD